MALPNNFTPYSSISASYDRLMGAPAMGGLNQIQSYDPIQYSQPTQNLRQNRDSITINSAGSQSPTQRIQSRANQVSEKIAGQTLGQLQAYGQTMQAIDPFRQAYLKNYRLTDQERQNVNRLTSQGYSPGFAFNNRTTQLTDNANTLNGRGYQNNYDQWNNSINAFNQAAGYNPTTSLDAAYNRIINRL